MLVKTSLVFIGVKLSIRCKRNGVTIDLCTPAPAHFTSGNGKKHRHAGSVVAQLCISTLYGGIRVWCYASYLNHGSFSDENHPRFNFYTS